jgi:two-component system sensor histidine kinase TctE
MASARSLRWQLLRWLLVPLALVAGLDAVVSYRDAVGIARGVQERMLLGAARVIGEQVRLEDGALQVVVPPAALELFASPDQDRVFYRATGPGDALLAGYDDLPLPRRRPPTESASFFDARIRGRAVRVVAYEQPIFSAGWQGEVLVQVAETQAGRDALVRDIWLTSVTRQAALVCLGALLVWFGLRRGLQPVTRLRDTMLARDPGSVAKLEEASVPHELQPLVAAINDYAGRLDRHMSAHSRFIADASHQLRTPLTVLNTQVTYALRNEDPVARGEALVAIRSSVQHGVHLVQQLLAFTTAESGAGGRPPQRVDLVEVVTAVLEREAWRAGERGIDLGFQGDSTGAIVSGNRDLLLELVSNLVDNALRYTPRGGQVTVGVEAGEGRVRVSVHDNGPGIPAAERERVFERFYRLQNSVSDGCGLGLAIVREIAASHGAEVRLQDGPAGRGLTVLAIFPFASGQDAHGARAVD